MSRWILLYSIAIGLPRAAVAQRTTSGDVVPQVLVARELWNGTTRYRLIPREHRQPDTTSWTVLRQPSPDTTRRLGMQVMVATSHGQRTVDTVAFDVKTLRAVWEHLHAGTSVIVTFDSAAVVGDSIRPDSPPRAFRSAIPGFAYSSTMDDVVIQRLPLRRGDVATLPFWDGDHVEIDTVRVRQSSQAAAQSSRMNVLIVDFFEPYAVETLWIERRTRRVIRHVYRWRRDGSHSDVTEVGIQASKWRSRPAAHS